MATITTFCVGTIAVAAIADRKELCFSAVNDASVNGILIVISTTEMAHAILISGEFEFDGQLMQTTEPSELYVPAPQSLQTADPVDALYFPATHAVHVPPSGPDDPTLQVQEAKDDPPADELEFGGHARHVDDDEDPTIEEYVPAPQSIQMNDPFDALYFPATHKEHVPPSRPTYPGIHEQEIKDDAPANEMELAGHEKQDTEPLLYE